ncbi:heavy metal-binding domain-containing protein, partial [Corynebacterium variabile]|uniref:heavy metal-binding domain-containing protein n=1 Tax=Corynebacterium variabile TaxID=1727 RepID=UPI0028AB0940
MSTTEYTCPMHPEVRQIGPGTCPTCGMALEPAGGDGADHAHGHDGHAHHDSTPTTQTSASDGVEYTCPMHPEVRQIGPGTCPTCGMALEPAGGDGADHAHG